MGAVKGTTPIFMITIPGYSLENKRVYVTIGQNEERITLTNEQMNVYYDGEGSIISLTLSQEQTLLFTSGDLEVQMKAISANGHVDASNIANTCISRALLNEVISYE